MGRDPGIVLVVEDSPGHAELIERSFRRAPELKVVIAADLAAARDRIAESEPEVALVAYLLPDGSGTELLPPAGERLAFPVVIMTSHGNEQVAVDAMKRGAIDYVVKSETSLIEMPEVARRALREHRLRLESERAQAAVRDSEKQYRAVFESSINGLTIRRLEDGSPPRESGAQRPRRHVTRPLEADRTPA